MTMYDLEAVSQLANTLYQKNFGPVSVREHSTAPPGPEEDTAVLQKSSSIKPAPDGTFTLKPGANYYFLSNSPVRSSGVAPIYSKGYDVEMVRRDFPILEQQVNGHPLIWLDNAATTQKPLPVIDALRNFYREINSNVHRGAHTLAGKATNAFETAREKVQQFIGAASTLEVIFVRGATEAINLVAQSYGRMAIGKGDEILVSVMEHHSNIVPWQQLCKQTGAVLRPIPINEQGEIMLGEYERLLSRRTRLVAVTQVSNVLGTINPVRLMAEMAHYYGARFLVDGAQAVPHFEVDVKTLDADFYTFSGHKIYGPTGIGILYGKRELLEEMPPWQSGGGMIQQVSFEETVYNHVPHKFEAGTANIAGAVGLGAAVDYLRKIGMALIKDHEAELTAYAMDRLHRIPGLRIFGTSKHKIAVISFVVAGRTSDDLARYLDRYGIAVRSGHHCAQPLLRRYGQTEMLRAALGLYNTRDEIDKLVEVVGRAIQNSL